MVVESTLVSSKTQEKQLTVCCVVTVLLQGVILLLTLSNNITLLYNTIVFKLGRALTLLELYLLLYCRGSQCKCS